MVLGFWKKREKGRTGWWCVRCLLCLLCLRCGDLGAVELMETGQGKVLIGYRAQGTGAEKITNAGSRDPFNWSAEFIDQYLARMRGKQDLFAGLQISGIVWDPQTPLVIINNVLLKEGEKVEDVTVVKISKDSVLLAREGSLHTLNFQQHIIDLGSQHVRGDERSEERK